MTIAKTTSTTPTGTDADDIGKADHVGQVINYTVVVTNTGNIDLTGVTVKIGRATCRGGEKTLAVNSSEELNGSQVVTQTDLDNGTALVNTASVTDAKGDTRSL